MATVSRTEIVALVSHLADCLTGTNCPSNHGDTYGQKEAAMAALACARETEERLAGLMERIGELEHLSLTDELTGLLNRRGFQMELKRVLASAERYDEQGALVYIDLDGFKPINDTYGHAAGDEVLTRVAAIIEDNVRDTDFVGRMGGDEFAVVLTRTTWDDGLKRAEILDKILNESYAAWNGRLISIRASFGFQGYFAKDESANLINRADEAMYFGKNHGRNRTHLDESSDGGPNAGIENELITTTTLDEEIGESKERVLIVDVSGRKKTRNHGYLVLVNPEITEWDGFAMGREGCLSVPDYTGNVVRAERIQLEALDRHGEPLSFDMDGFEARAIQHEMDHLDGLLFLDRLVSRRQDLFQRKVYKQ